MISTRSLLTKLSKRFPKRLAKKHHDFVGHMAGKLPNNVSRIVLCLDLDETIIEEVIAFKPDLVITHHPLVYGTRSRVFKRDHAKKTFVEYLDKENIAVYSIHTNFDEGFGGMNDALAEALGLTNIIPLERDQMARGGNLKNPMDINEFSVFAKNVLNADYGLLVAEGVQTIRSAAIVGGGGSRSWRNAKEEGYDIYISGDAPHYVRRDVILNKYNYLDLPHEIENIFMPRMTKILLSFDESLHIKQIIHEKQPKVIK